MRLPKLFLDVCENSDCQTHCSYSVHGEVKVFARSCCHEDYGEQLCRVDWLLFQKIFFLLSIVCILFCFFMIIVIVREKRHEQNDRGWALMEAFFMGAIILYAIPLLGWPEHIPWSCWIADFGRQLGFTLFYGSVILKIYRNLQEYRVRKAQHVIVRELDLILYLLFAILIVLYEFLLGLQVLGPALIYGRPSGPNALWKNLECFFLFVNNWFCFMELGYVGYKARNSSWVERYQFTMAVILEAIISLVASSIRYALNEVGSRDALFLVAVLQLHLTISLNIFSTENTARGTLNSGNATAIIGSNRAHPSLAKMRENLINGTIDFQEVPIVDMNPEDIRAELKRVYTQLRMYKLKNAYQDNPHISKRKGGAGIKKVVHHQQSTTECNNNIGGGGKTSRAASASAAIDRRISIPPQIINSTSNNSPNKFQQQQQKLIEEEKNNDLTVESAPHNIHLLTTSSNSSIKLNSPTDIPLISSSDQSIRV
uniref:G-protein coupled receptors family 3 profile domain-containing protein n=1 Tax=Meloidogyne enterolobii TaxID=390850 RepID=A0A6V7UKE0_MELEN|nr:unnamed protein product [Meloidogyne enterolobii]